MAIADLACRKANLEHAAASVATMMQTAVLVLLLTLVLMTFSGPDLAVIHVHPTTPLLFLAAGFGFQLVYRTCEEPIWQPKQTPETVEDVPAPEAQGASLPKLLGSFGLTAAAVLGAGAAVAWSAGEITEQTGLSESLMGGLFTASATSLPEFVTSVAAVRHGALTLAVSDIVGGNFFDVQFVGLADLAYLEGSLYHAPGVSHREEFLAGLAVLLNIVLLMGLLYRQSRGPANIGFANVLLLVCYLGGFLILSLLLDAFLRPLSGSWRVLVRTRARRGGAAWSGSLSGLAVGCVGVQLLAAAQLIDDGPFPQRDASALGRTPNHMGADRHGTEEEGDDRQGPQDGARGAEGNGGRQQ